MSGKRKRDKKKKANVLNSLSQRLDDVKTVVPKPVAVSPETLKELEQKIQQLTINSNIKNGETADQKQQSKRLVGYYHQKIAEWYGSYVWETYDGKEITITEVCEEGLQPVTVNCGPQFAGPVKRFVRRLCPTDDSKESNCFCKTNIGVYSTKFNQQTLKEQGF